jgi:formylglycine-generating enzyme required for sulfatase activity
LQPAEDCASSQDSREVPEIALDDFYLDKHEVTNRDFAAWLEANPEAWRYHPPEPTYIETVTKPHVDLARARQECSLAIVEGRVRPGSGKANQPVTCVTWMAARDYCRAQGKRLPSELEWELAAKGVEGRAFPWGRSMPRHDGVTFDRGNSIEKHPADIGTSDQDISPQGVRDLGGNVAEWVMDHRGGSSEIATIRGGSWNSKDPCRLLGSSCERIKATKVSTDVGFRCAKSVVQDKGGS